jgi:hypothetical protein
MNPPDIPAACPWALKEWSGILRAIREGRQSILLRKGGIAEPAHRFQPDLASGFWLYPTITHQAQQGLLPGSADDAPAPRPGTVALDLYCRLVDHWFLTDESQLARLADWHVWTAQTIRNRFFYRQPGLHLLLLESWVRDAPHLIPLDPEHAGCKSWISLEPPPALDRLCRIAPRTACAALHEQLSQHLGSPQPRPGTESISHG